MRFDQDANAVHVKYQISVDGSNGLELYTIMNAMDVSIYLSPIGASS